MRNWGWPQWMLVVGIILLLILGALAAWLFLSPRTAVTPPRPGEPGAIGTLPTPTPGRPTFPVSDIERIPLSQIQGTNIDQGQDLMARGGVTRLDTVANFPVEFVNRSSNGSSLNYYDPETKRFYRIDADGVISKIGQQVFAEVQDVTWAPNASDAILEFPDGSNIRYNFDTNEQVTFPTHWDDFAFSPNSQSLAFKSNAADPDERWLAISDTNGSNTRLIQPLGNNGDIVTVDWAPNNQVVATYSETDGLTRSELFFVGFNDENFPLSKLEGLKFEGKWVPDGKKLMYSVAHQNDEFRPRLWLADGAGASMGQNRQALSIETWPHKCTFVSAETAYCGVPTSLPRGAGLIPAVADDVPDELFKVDLRTGTTSKVATPETDINVASLTVSEDGKTLFVHDSFTKTIQKINL
ncbi:MAG: hypothetical protein HY461_02145 [Parcubacteria group bacterium]|nr:hypothetical protein [Parcubacteria group bacterium]